MWWYNILGDNKGSISDLLRIDPIAAGSILLNVKLVAPKREIPEPILNKKSCYCIICDVFAACSFVYSVTVALFLEVREVNIVMITFKTATLS